MRAYAVTTGRSKEADTPSGKRLEASTARVALVCYPEAGLLVIQARPPARTGGVVLDQSDLTDEALAVLRVFVGDTRANSGSREGTLRGAALERHM